MIDAGPLPLAVGAVIPLHLAGSDKSLLRGDAVSVQAAEKILRSAFHLPLLVGVLQPEIEHSTGRVGGQLIHHRGVQGRRDEGSRSGWGAMRVTRAPSFSCRGGYIFSKMLRRDGHVREHGVRQFFLCSHVVFRLSPSHCFRRCVPTFRTDVRPPGKKFPFGFRNDSITLPFPVEIVNTGVV